MAKPSTKKTYDCTIDPQLFETFKMLRRWEDAKLLQEQTGFSRPTIDKALNFGHIRDLNLETALTTFYNERAQDQRNQAKKILSNLLK